MRTCHLDVLMWSGLVVGLGSLSAGDEPAAANTPTTQTTPAAAPGSQPAGKVVDFQPGIRIDWGERQVEVDAVVVLRKGFLELFACSPQTREHESIVCIQARPLHVYHALGLLGLEPGHPIRFDPQANRVEPATGDPVEIAVRYTRDGRLHTEPIERWMRRAETDEAVGRQDWVFAGSVALPDREGIEADLEGTVIAVVDFPTALVALPEFHTDRNAELWLEPATEAIPPLGTACTLVFRQGPLRLRLDAKGHLSLQGKPSTFAAAARAVREATRENPNRRVHVVIDPDSPQPDQRLLRRLLDQLGLPKAQLTIEATETSSLQPHDAQTWLAWLDGHLTSTRPAGAAGVGWAASTHQLADDLRERSGALRMRTEDVTRYVRQTAGDLRRLFPPQTAPAR